MDILLLVVAGALLIFMFWSSSRRRKKMQEEEHKRQQQLVPGAPVMTRSGLYGTLVAFDADDLTKHAVIEIAPGVNIEVHAQTVTLDPATDEPVAEDELDEEPLAQDEIVEHDAADDRRDDETKRD
ncbi:preprotein translocase subunit YajC [Microbacterium excoecariae]|uniref:preprotein translocase subunit YajC n=1 Tax=Microbacterium excoecariae TaxID=2715210 RepID=UPI00140D8AC0|nr:preprotein translocase subunit YajC [Microbacterium excoecariae]NHI17133.1 preprotein translocase subunit YajC [Microbacterium excoecariae]